MATKLINLLLPISAFLLPLTFWTLTPNFFSSPQALLLFLTTGILLGIYFFTTLTHRTITLPRSPLLLPLSLLAVSLALNLVLVREGAGEALVGKAGVLFALILTTWLVLTVRDRTHLSQRVITASISSSVVLAVHSLLQLMVLYRLTSLPSFMQTQAFTPTGSFVTTLGILILGGVLIISQLKSTSQHLRPLYFAGLITLIVAVVAIVALMLPGGVLAWRSLPYQASWSIILDAFKSTRALVLGVGLGNFSSLYTGVKPLSLNLTPLWNALPNAASSEFFTLLATGGLAITGCFVWLFLSAWRSANSPSLHWGLIFLLVAFFLIPFSLPLYFLLFLFLAIRANVEHTTLHLPTRVSLVTGGLGLALTIAALFFVARGTMADVLLRRAQLALARDDGRTAYDNYRQAISMSPQSAPLHIAFAEINLALASALSQKSDLTDADRETVSTLISQSISAGKSAASLRPNYSLTWVTLGKTYRNLINVADGAERFALDNYARAVALDPANPLLRIEYGGLFYQLGQVTQDDAARANYFGRAQTEFQTAIQLKPDLSNAYYNLSKLLETAKDYQNAYLAMQKVVSTLDPNSPDYPTALAELETLKAKLPAPTPSESPAPSPTTDLTTPSPLPSPLPGGPLELPTESPTPNL